MAQASTLQAQFHLFLSIHKSMSLITTKFIIQRWSDFTIYMYISWSLGDFKEFAEIIDAVKDKGVVVAVASPDDVDNANKERPNFFEIKKAL